MVSTSEDLFRYLDDIGVEYKTHEHAPTFTVDEGREMKQNMPGGHTKNLFMKDKAGQLVLISAEADHALPLNRLHRRIGTGRLSFASAELMEQHLGITPGSVTAFALMNDPGQTVRFVLDQMLLDHDPINFHPLRNDMTTAISLAGFRTFVESLDRSLEVIDFDSLLEEADPNRR